MQYSLIFKKCSDCFVLRAVPLSDLTMALRSKSAYSAQSAAKLHIIIILYCNNPHKKSAWFLSLNPKNKANAGLLTLCSIAKYLLLLFSQIMGILLDFNKQYTCRTVPFFFRTIKPV